MNSVTVAAPSTSSSSISDVSDLPVVLQHPDVSRPLRETYRRSVGARLHRCALQVNPFEYRDRHGKGSIPFTTEDDYNAAMVGAALAADVKAIAIMDHFRARTSETLRRAAHEAGIVVLPGFEAASHEGIHVLCLFDPSISVDELERIIGMCGVIGGADPSPRSGLTCPKLTKLVVERGGLCLGAHATNKNGVLSHVAGGTRIDAWRSESLAAVAIPGSIADVPEALQKIIREEDPNHRRARPMAVINARDVSDPDHFASSGHTTRLMLSSCDLEGVRQACLDPESRVCLDSADPPKDSHEISAIAWEGGFLDGQGIRFNNSLNVIIGGRGAGKSAIIESLRFVFDYPIRGLDAKTTSEKIIQSVLGKNARVSVLVKDMQSADQYHLIERRVGGDTIVRGTDGAILERMNPLTLVPGLEVYGQHELSEITRSKKLMAEIVERFGEQSEEDQVSERDIERQMTDSTNRIREELDRIGVLEADTESLSAIRLQLQKLKAMGVEERLVV